MILLPAIDIRGGKAVRLRQGDFAQETIYQDDVHYYAEDGLIDVTYPGQFPVLLSVSPQLAVLDGERANVSERLLAERSRQVFEALKENTRLSIELLEAEQRARATRDETELLA